MCVQKGKRAARANNILSGNEVAWKDRKQLKLWIRPEVLRVAKHYRICAPHGKNAVTSIAQYLEDKILEDAKKIREGIKGVQ